MLAWRTRRRHLAVAIFGTAAIAAATAAPAAQPTRTLPATSRQEPVCEALLRLGQAGGFTVVISDDVQGNVDLALARVTPEAALHAICEQLALRCVRSGHTVSVFTRQSAVVPLTIVPAARAAAIVRKLYPDVLVTTVPSGNGLIVDGPPRAVQAARTILQSLDVRDATKPSTGVIVLKVQTASTVADRLRTLFPKAHFVVAGHGELLVTAVPADLTEIRTLVGALDAATPMPEKHPVASEAIRITQRSPSAVARSVAREFPHLRTGVSGATIVLTGAPDDVARAKALVAAIDLPPFDARYTQIYRLKNVDALSVANLVRTAFPGATVTVDSDINALSVTATAAEQQRIADGVAQLDGATSGQGVSPLGAGGGPAGHAVVQLRSIIPGSQQPGSSMTPQDFASAVTQALQTTHPDLHVIPAAATQQLILTGSSMAIRDARALIEELDVVPQSVILDTEVLEVDQNSSKNLGLQLGTTSIGTTFSEVQPTPDPSGNPVRIMRPLPLTRTGISFQAQLNLLVQNGKARVLADPRITTISGRTATIRAGDTISILTTVGGGAGTIATTQLQSFQTGVTLDITPIITNAGELNVALHPIVNSLTGFFNGVPEISTRDAQTAVHLRDNETLVIGGLIQENQQATTSKVPLVGDIPLIGRVFRNEQVTGTRNELIIVVTPHILSAGNANAVPSAATIRAIPTPAPLPTLPPGTVFPYIPPASTPRSLLPPLPRVPTPRPTVTPIGIPTVSSPSPLPAASAFAHTNVFVYGSPPPSTYAGPGDPPTIYYATLSPTIASPTTILKIDAVASGNVRSVTIGTSLTNAALTTVGPGLWQGRFTPAQLGVPGSSGAYQLSLIATRSDGVSTRIAVPLAIQPP